jgi:hypothetical protein
MAQEKEEDDDDNNNNNNNKPNSKNAVAMHFSNCILRKNLKIKI